MQIEKRMLKFVNKDSIIKLFNDPLVKRYMPLCADNFDEKQYWDFITAKESIWKMHGFGPWAYFIYNEFAGWGGIQPDKDDFELALVLSPAYWGYGRKIYTDLIQEAFTELNLNSVIILFPPSRTRIKWILKAGFVEEDRININDECFIRFRLNNPKLKTI